MTLLNKEGLPALMCAIVFSCVSAWRFLAVIRGVGVLENPHHKPKDILELENFRV